MLFSFFLLQCYLHNYCHQCVATFQLEANSSQDTNVKCLIRLSYNSTFTSSHDTGLLNDHVSCWGNSSSFSWVIDLFRRRV
ncbi:hypothetical protein PR003_g23710 [Phytophthora rubi]|uniref:Secreted protein n=1 Tax=Phytophthora rubi TaxID=129364 RepID=A0A6A3IP82_9STRA|nr:hypothetical protein PR002_g23125 [Phytophthora rubi]KAE8986121.1 hypothetical protein PR001_g22686 [Phytophthora rubi]KAE9296625.1 hypothetical protein PR003_g23710 [Phytophthora rubi]